MGTGTKIVLVLCLIVFCGSGYYLADYYLKAHQAQSAFSELAEDNDDRDLAALYQKNNDLVGWVEVEGTKIDYPVMQTKDEGEDPEFYLHRDFDKEYSDSGTPFMDVSSDIYVPTWNWLIYGHHMKSGIMFHDLVKYEDREFYEKHPTFEFETINQNGQSDTFQVIAACYSKIYPDDRNVFKYYEYAGFTDEEREKFSKVLASGMTDTFRHFYPDKTGAYSWWSYRFHARENNAGWRIDYFVTSRSLDDKLEDALIYSDVKGSDHCPVGLVIRDGE